VLLYEFKNLGNTNENVRLLILTVKLLVGNVVQCGRCIVNAKGRNRSNLLLIGYFVLFFNFLYDSVTI